MPGGGGGKREGVERSAPPRARRGWRGAGQISRRAAPGAPARQPARDLGPAAFPAPERGAGTHERAAGGGRQPLALAWAQHPSQRPALPHGARHAVGARQTAPTPPGRTLARGLPFPAAPRGGGTWQLRHVPGQLRAWGRRRWRRSRARLGAAGCYSLLPGIFHSGCGPAGPAPGRARQSRPGPDPTREPGGRYFFPRSGPRSGWRSCAGSEFPI